METKTYTYEEFKQMVCMEVKKALPDYRVSIEQIIKNNDTVLDAIIIRDDSSIAPSIYLNQFYKCYQDGYSMEELIRDIIEMRNNSHLECDTTMITDFKRVKDHIACRLVNAEYNQKRLEGLPHTILEETDLAVIYYIRLCSIENEGEMTASVTEDLMEIYGINMEVLHKTAMENTFRIYPPRFCPLPEILNELIVQCILNDGETDLPGIPEGAEENFEMKLPMYVITNHENRNGAIGVLNSAIMDYAAEKLGDFYILPASIHEVLLVVKDSELDAESLQNMVREVNNDVLPDELLSDHIYEYDREMHRIRICR